jgi:hypothetical protein
MVSELFLSVAQYWVGYGFGIIVTTIIAILIHEASHFRKAEKLGLDANWVFSWKPFKLGIRTKLPGTLKQQMSIIEDGFFNGLWVVILSFLFLDWWALVVLAMYLMGSKGDISKWYQLKKARKLEGETK